MTFLQNTVSVPIHLRLVPCSVIYIQSVLYTVFTIYMNHNGGTADVVMLTLPAVKAFLAGAEVLAKAVCTMRRNKCYI